MPNAQRAPQPELHHGSLPAENTTVIVPATTNVSDAQLRLKPQAISAPNVTISPWAKSESPVVPKISESPIEVIAMIVASSSPLARVCGSWLHLLGSVRTFSPRLNSWVVELFAAIRG